MPKFSYQAYLANGQIENGYLQASDKQEAIRQLTSQQKQVFQMEEVPLKERGSFSISLSGKPDLQRFFEDLSELVASGIKVDTAIKIISDNASNNQTQEFAKAVLSDVVSGQSLFNALSNSTHVPDDVLGLISSGEESGRLHEVLSVISQSEKKARKRKSELFEILSYPVFLILVMIFAILAIAGFLVPAIEPLFSGSSQEPPFILKAFLLLRDVGDELLFVTSAVFLVMVLAFTIPLTRSRLWKFVSYSVLKTPVIGNAVRWENTGRYLRSFSIMTDNNIPVHDAAKLAVTSIKNISIREKLSSVSSQLVEGQELPSVFDGTGVFEPEIISIISIGDRINKLATVSKRAADLLEARSDRSIKTLTAILSPTITILMGGLIGLLAYSVMTTLLSINQLAV